MGKKKKFNVEATGAEETKTSSKRDAVTGGGKSGKGDKSSFMGMGIAIVIIAAIAFVMFGGGAGAGGFTVVSAEAGVVKIPIADVSDSKAHFFTYKGDLDINFFVLKSSDGVIRAAFDACDVCYREKKGYRQEGDTMVCNNCGQRFPSVKINEIKGGCNPTPLEREVQGNYLVMKVSDIEKGGFYF